MKYDKQLYANKRDNLEEMDQFLETRFFDAELGRNRKSEDITNCY